MEANTHKYLEQIKAFVEAAQPKKMMIVIQGGTDGDGFVLMSSHDPVQKQKDVQSLMTQALDGIGMVVKGKGTCIDGKPDLRWN